MKAYRKGFFALTIMIFALMLYRGPAYGEDVLLSSGHAGFLNDGAAGGPTAVKTMAQNEEDRAKSTEGDRAPAAETKGPEAGPDSGVPAEGEAVNSVVLNFDNADIYQVVRTIAEILDIDYVIDPAVKGTVNVHTKGRLTREDLFGILSGILKVNGAVMVRDDGLYHIVPAQSAGAMLLAPAGGVSGTYSGDRVIIQIIKLDYISAKDAANILKPFITPGAVLTAFDRSNLLLVADFESNTQRITGIIELLDVNFFENVRLRLYPLKEAAAEDVAGEMEKIFSALEMSNKGRVGARVNFVPITRINSLLVISSISSVLDEVEKWLKELDHRLTSDEVQTYIYHVKNGIADELAEILNKVFGESTSQKEDNENSATSTQKTSMAAAEEGEKKAYPASSKSGEVRSTRTITGEVKVLSYPTTNTIIIKATPRDYSVVKSILDELDIMPRQVMIEILIAEVTLNDENLFGIEFSLRGRDLGNGVRSGLVGTSLGLSTAGTLASGGLTASVIQGDLLATLNALASESRVNILASPHIIASDGKEASIDIGDEVPLIASKIFVDQREEVTIERRDTGILLNVTPHINTTGLVTLDVSLELSDASKALLEGESDIRIFQRNAKTSMVVQDGQTVVIGGLIDEKKEDEISKVPVLGDLPFIGLIFRSDKKVTKKTELLLLITPRVIHNLDQANDVTVEFLEKLKAIKKSLENSGRLPSESGT